MFATLEEFRQQAQIVLDVFDTWAGEFKPSARVDHLGFKCQSTREFETARALFESQSAFVYQSIISGRRIALIKFLQPLPTVLGDIWLLELSDQKPDQSQVSGFDHLEIYPERGSFEELVQELESRGQALQKVVRPHHTTYDGVLSDTFKVRLEPEPLLVKVKATEFR